MDQLKQVRDSVEIFMFDRTAMTFPEKIRYSNYLDNFTKMANKALVNELLSTNDLNDLFLCDAYAREYGKLLHNLNLDNVDKTHKVFTWVNLSKIIMSYLRLMPDNSDINCNDERLVLIYMYRKFSAGIDIHKWKK